MSCLIPTLQFLITSSMVAYCKRWLEGLRMRKLKSSCFQCTLTPKYALLCSQFSVRALLFNVGIQTPLIFSLLYCHSVRHNDLSPSSYTEMATRCTTRAIMCSYTHISHTDFSTDLFWAHLCMYHTYLYTLCIASPYSLHISVYCLCTSLYTLICVSLILLIFIPPVC